MDFLAKATQQLRELYEGMTPSARLVTALLTTAIAISLFFLFSNETISDAYVYGGQEFSQAELAAMETALGQAGLNDGEIVGNRLRVPRTQKAAYLSAIAKAGAVPLSGKTLSDPNSFGSPFDTRAVSDAREKSRKQKKIEDMLEQNYENVSCEYSEVRKNNLTRDLVRSAAVSLKASGSQPLDAQDLRTIQRMVMMAVGSIEPQNIVVVDQNTGESSVGVSPGDISDPVNNRYAMTKKYYEDMWRSKIESRLHDYEDVNVQVNVLLDETLADVKQTNEIGTPVVVENETEKETSESIRQDPAGRPGVVPNTGAANGAESVTTNQNSSSTSSKNRESTQSRVGESIQQVEKARLVPKEVSVSIGIPYHYYRQYYMQTTEPKPTVEPTYSELSTVFKEVEQDVTDIVQPLILLPTTGEDIFDNIVVKPVLKIPDPPKNNNDGEWYDPAKEWLIDQGNWQVLGMLVLGLVGLFVLRGMVKASATPSQDSPAALAAGDEPASSVAGGAGDKEEESAKPKRKFSSDGPNIKEELSELIQDDPDTAANVLKQWIGETV